MKIYVNCYINFHYLLTPKQPKVFAALLFTEDTLLLPAHNCIKLQNIEQEDRSEIQAKRDWSRGKCADMGGFPFPILCCRFCPVVMVSHPTSPYSTNIGQVLAESLLFQHPLGSSLNSTKLRELLQVNTDSQEGPGPAPQWVADSTPTDTIFFSPRVTWQQELQSKFCSLEQSWSVVLTHHATESLPKWEMNKMAVSKLPFPTVCKDTFSLEIAFNTY